MRSLVGQALPAIFFVFTLAACGGSEPPARLRVGDTAPEFTLPRLGGNVVAASELAGDVVVLNFWATWCQPCLREIPVFKRLDARGVKIVGIALDEEGERAVRPFVERHGLGYMQLLGDQEVFERFGGLTIPYTLVLDAERRIVNYYRGPATQEALEADLAEAAGNETGT